MIRIIVGFTNPNSELVTQIAEGGSWSFRVLPDETITGILVVSDQPSVLSPACREEGTIPEDVLPTR